MSEFTVEDIHIDKGGHNPKDGKGCVMDEWERAFAGRFVAVGDCWMWMWTKPERNGYAKRTYRRRNWWVHRLSLTLVLGREPKGDTRHSCDERLCIRPEHLSEGSRSENMNDCSERGRHNKPRGEGHWHSKLTDAQVNEMRVRRHLGAKQCELAVDYGVHPATVSRIVRGVWR